MIPTDTTTPTAWETDFDRLRAEQRPRPVLVPPLPSTGDRNCWGYEPHPTFGPELEEHEEA